jgi:hypothetical protein
MPIKIINGITFFGAAYPSNSIRFSVTAFCPFFLLDVVSLVLSFDLLFVCGRRRLSMSYQT